MEPDTLPGTNPKVKKKKSQKLGAIIGSTE